MWRSIWCRRAKMGLECLGDSYRVSDWRSEPMEYVIAIALISHVYAVGYMARKFELRSACCHCFFWNESAQKCWHDWPGIGQRRWPLDAKDPETGVIPHEVAFCKEFELK